MEGISVLERFFPLQDISEVVQLFRYEMENTKEPDLTLLSIVVGSIENLLTCNRTNIIPSESDIFGNPKLPTIEYKIVDALYKKFHSTIKGYVDMSVFGNIKYATRELVKRVSDVIWNSLTRSYYKDRAHLQSLYSYLTGSKLDCFGVAFAVVAACQVLGFSDVHLALSEDHAWVTFGENSSETAEVTWHGKGNEDKRGQSIDAGVASKCWLYLNGHSVRCNRYMEVAALVSAINPSLNVNSDAIEVALLQQELLWLLYDTGHLASYPMAIGNLGDLEEINPSAGRLPCSSLFQEAIITARAHYKNMHVYPYTYQGGYFYRHNMYKEAFESWANASDVLKQYNYTRDDEEIYKEVMEIANELIPHIMKVVSGHSARSILKDPDCFAHLLRFYDGICQWEEGSQTPVLHIGWAKPLVNTISKFDSKVRGQVAILEHDFDNEAEEEKNCNNSLKKVNVANSKNDFTAAAAAAAAAAAEATADDNHDDDEEKKENGKPITTTTELIVSGTPATNDVKNDSTDSGNLHPGIKELTAACGEKLLNRDFLIQGGGEPFVGDTDVLNVCPPDTHETDILESVNSAATHQPRIILSSEKMRGLKNLLLGEKLNTHAISLQLTAQSQVQIGSKKSVFRECSDTGVNVRSKRSRRE